MHNSFKFKLTIHSNLQNSLVYFLRSTPTFFQDIRPLVSSVLQSPTQQMATRHQKSHAYTYLIFVFVYPESVLAFTNPLLNAH